jgi:hypothetical protein
MYRKTALTFMWGPTELAKYKYLANIVMGIWAGL